MYKVVKRLLVSHILLVQSPGQRASNLQTVESICLIMTSLTQIKSFFTRHISLEYSLQELFVKFIDCFSSLSI